MPYPIFKGFSRRRPPSEAAPASPPPAAPNGPPSPEPAAAVSGEAAPAAPAAPALDLARELLRGVEHFVLSTPDLDAPGFLERLRRTAGALADGTSPEELEAYRQWVATSLTAFGQLQRRYLSEREDELWRLLTLYQEALGGEGSSNEQFADSLRGMHERMGEIIRLDDLRQVRERLQSELSRASTLIDQKTREDRERAQRLAQQVQQLETALAAARHDAARDALTGVYHRGGFQSQLAAALESPSGCSLAIMDVDNFKGINDALGHLVGDEILRIAVQLLGKIARPGDVIGRFGGDEFCLLAPATPARRLADRLESIANPRNINFEYENRLRSVRLSLSAGVAASQPGDTVNSLIQRADEALLAAKREGKAQVQVAASRPAS